MTQTTTLTGHIADLSGDATVISGAAIGANDVTLGMSGDKKVWIEAELRKAAKTLEGTEINPLHSNQTVGRITRAGFDDSLGAIVYEAEVNDEKLAAQVESGSLEVSIEARHHDGGVDENTGAMIASDIEFTGMALVQKGASPSNSAEAGPSKALASLSAGDIKAALAEPPVSYDGTKGGKLDESKIPNDDYRSHYLVSKDSKSESSFPVVDANGNLRRGNVESAWSMRGQGDDIEKSTLEGHLKSLNSAFDNPPIEAEQNARDDDGETQSTRGESTDVDATTDEPMSDNESTPDIEALTERLGDMEERNSELESKVESLQAENEDLDDEVQSVKETYAATLAEHGPFDEDELVEMCSVKTLREKFEGMEAELAPDPTPDVQGGESETETESLSAEEQEEVEQLKAEIAELEGSDTRLGKNLKQAKEEELAELTEDN